MKMMPMVSRIITAKITIAWYVSALVHRIVSWEGITAMIDTKMSNDMPLPIPRWVMSSPIHMSSAVPAVMVITMMMTFRGVKSGIRSMPPVNWPLWNR